MGCNLVQAGSHPLKMNIGPSFASLFHQVSCFTRVESNIQTVRTTYESLMTPAMVAFPEAVMIRDLITSAGEHTAASSAPFSIDGHPGLGIGLGRTSR